MPGGDGTGPRKTGKGAGQGIGKGRGRTVSRGRAAGPAGDCVCASCGNAVPHTRGVPCSQLKCPRCGNMMIRR
jgi:hypothetical protein